MELEVPMEPGHRHTQDNHAGHVSLCMERSYDEQDAALGFVRGLHER